VVPDFLSPFQRTARGRSRRIVIPNKTGKKFPKYYLQSTWKITFQHTEIEELVEYASLNSRVL
jgi:hypothetical protein